MARVETSADPVRIELEKILASPGFVHNKRLSGFLEYVVLRYLEGNADQVKEIGIGVDVFGRKPDYDPRHDSVVRTEAAKLRARLTEYYLALGASDPVVIAIPKGHYVPAIRFVEAPSLTLAAIKKIREALRALASIPRFVGTVPRHGYRLICEIMNGREASQSLPSEGGQRKSNSGRWSAWGLAAAGLLAVLWRFCSVNP